MPICNFRDNHSALIIIKHYVTTDHYCEKITELHVCTMQTDST